ncbi:DUF1330 domain-containing protein [Halioxenophilus sp. WMMB6]|uniref:DUF1330 domain-containing protein n=1 Tax=Halioxenophilus sp. WMMB6 TaxID=3073815 RepID=UPI00295EDDE8|nr:DUF1330 domain-containing protein [Halioxenophilus sp. WMMB6]
MKAAVIVDIEVTNPTIYKEYIELITPSVFARGGRYLVRGGNPQTLDGNWQSSRMVVMEFPSREVAVGWLEDESLSDIHNMRRNNSSKCNMIICDMIE